MSFPIPDADKYIAFSKVQDPSQAMPGWVVVAVLETENPISNYDNGHQVYMGQMKSHEFMVGLPGTREQADLFARVKNLEAEVSRIESLHNAAKNEWEKKEKDMKAVSDDYAERARRFEKANEATQALLTKKDKEIERLKGEIARLKESMASVMLLVADNQKASVAEVAEAQKVGEIMGDEKCGKREE